MNFTTNNPTHPLFASPVRHELDVATVQAVDLRALPSLYEVFSTMIVVADGFLNAIHAARRTEEAEGHLVDGLRDHLSDLREAVVLTMEERRPSTLDEARERNLLLLLANLGAGATIEEAVARLDRDFREPEPTRS